MAGEIVLVLFSSVFMLVLSIEINYHECQRKQSTLQCPWRGVGNYEVTVPMLQEVLQVEKLTKESTLIVPERFSGRLTKIEVLQGDASCMQIVAPSFVSVYVDRQRCMKMTTSTPASTLHLVTPTKADFTPTKADFTPTKADFTPTKADFTPTTGDFTSTTATSTVTVTRHSSPEHESGVGEILSYIFGVVIVVVIVLVGMLLHLIRKYKRQESRLVHNLPMQEFPKDHTA